MASEAELAELIQLGQDAVSFELYGVSLTALLVYDYFLTLKDEVRYAWKMDGVLVFVLFLITRYLPALYQVWVVILLLYPGYTSECRSCKKTAFVEVLYYAFVSASAQIVLAQRTYAITKKNKWVAGVLYTISITQLCIGTYMAIRAAVAPVVETPAILDALRLCRINTQEVFTVIQMILPLIFDIIVFALVTIQMQFFKSMRQGLEVPKILETVGRDTEIYFAVITTSHLLIVIMHVAAREGIRSIPALGNAVLIPMMISRTIISVKKVASSHQPLHMSAELPDGSPVTLQDACDPHSTEAIRLSVFKKQQV